MSHIRFNVIPFMLAMEASVLTPQKTDTVPPYTHADDVLIVLNIMVPTSTAPGMDISIP